MFGPDTYAVTQRTFKSLMQGMSRPGTVVPLPDLDIVKGSVSYNPFSALCYTLLDHEVTFSVIGKEAHDDLINHIFTLTKAAHVQSENADYVFVTGGGSGNTLEHLRCGTPEFPDTSATVVYLAGSFGGEGGIAITLNGPGIKDTESFSVQGVDRKDIEMIFSMNAEYPLGVDIIFIDQEHRIVCVPRSSRMIVGE